MKVLLMLGVITCSGIFLSACNGDPTICVCDETRNPGPCPAGPKAPEVPPTGNCAIVPGMVNVCGGCPTVGYTYGFTRCRTTQDVGCSTCPSCSRKCSRVQYSSGTICLGISKDKCSSEPCNYS